MDPARLAERHPGLFTRSMIDYANVDIVFSLDPVEPADVTRLHLIARTAEDRVLVCRSTEGWRFLPGGQHEPGETLDQLAARELMEEAGAELLSDLDLFGAHVAVSHDPEPYRAHWPHPRALWAYAVCRAEVVGAPTSPEGTEVITDVKALAVAEAITYLAGHDQLMADVLALAVDLGLVGGADGSGGGCQSSSSEAK